MHRYLSVSSSKNQLNVTLKYKPLLLFKFLLDVVRLSRQLPAANLLITRYDKCMTRYKPMKWNIVSKNRSEEDNQWSKKLKQLTLS